jgi:hypothetical protein
VRKIPIELSGPPQTMLATLYAKALDADADHPVLGDSWARDAVARIDYDWSRTTITRRSAPSVAVRSAHFDRWARQFLAGHPRATVVHLGCGLDARAFRLDPDPGVRWYDVDYPDVIALRARLYPRRDDYTMVAASVTDPACAPVRVAVALGHQRARRHPGRGPRRPAVGRRIRLRLARVRRPGPALPADGPAGLDAACSARHRDLSPLRILIAP